MSEEKKADAPPAAAPAEASGPKPSKLPMLVALVNLLAIGGAMGMLVYTKLIFKRPAITEATERARLEKLKASPLPEAEPGYVDFPKTTINIASKDRARSAVIAFSVEVRDKTRTGEIEAVRPLIMDRVLSIVGRLQLADLTNVQGRYVLRAKLIDAANEILQENAGKLKAPGEAKPAAAAGGEGGEGGGEHGEGGEGGAKAAPKPVAHAPIVGDLVSNVFFTQFIAQ